MVDPRRWPLPERISTVGESFAEVGAFYLRETVGLRDHLDQAQMPKFGLRFFVGGASDLGDRVEVGPLSPSICEMREGHFTGLPLRTHHVDRGRLENELARRCRQRGVQVWEGSRAERVELTADGHRIQLIGDRATMLRARWVITAAGAAGVGRTVARRSLGHRIRAAWTRVEGELDVGAWSDRPDFAARTLPGLRRYSTNHLMGKGYWAWVIPLPTGATSVGVVADPDVVDFTPASVADLVEWLRPRDARLAEELAASTPVDGDFHTVKLDAYRAARCFSEDRWAVVGQSAASVDALYSPGGDLIAVGNSLLTEIVDRDFAGERVAAACAVANRVFAGFAEGFAEIYRGQYGHFGSPALVATKVTWDSALYFGFHTLLFRHGLFGDPRFLAGARAEVRAVQSLQARVQGRFRAGDVRPLVDVTEGAVEWGAIEWLMAAYFGAREQPDRRAIGAELRRSLASLEELARRLEGK